MSIPAGASYHVTTTNGTVYFYSGAAAAAAIMASMVRLEVERSEKLANDISKLKTSGTVPEPITATLILTAIGTIAGVVGAAAATASLGAQITDMALRAKPSSGAGYTTAVIEIENKNAGPVVLQAYSSSKCNVSKTPETLSPGESDSFSIISETEDGWDGSGDSTTQFTMSFLVGGGLTEENVQLIPINVTCAMVYSSDPDWKPAIGIDGCQMQISPDAKQAFAAVFVSGKDNVLDFTVSSIGIEEQTGEMVIQFLPSSESMT